MASYAIRKHEQLHSLGYDEYRLSMKVTFATESVEQLVDAFLGRGDLNLQRFKSFERRFDIERPGPAELARLGGMAGATMRITPHPIDRWRLEFTAEATGEIARLEGEVFFPGLPGLPKRYRKILIKTPIMDICIARDKLTIEVSDGIDRAQTLSVWEHTLRARRILRSGKCQVMAVSAEAGVLMFQGNCGEGLEIGDDGNIYKIVEAAQELQKRAGADDAPVALDAIFEARRDIWVAYKLMTIGEPEQEFTVTTDKPLVEVPKDGVYAIYLCSFSIGGYMYGYGLRGILSTQADGDLTKWIFTKIEPLIVEPGAELTRIMMRFAISYVWFLA